MLNASAVDAVMDEWFEVNSDLWNQEDIDTDGIGPLSWDEFGYETGPEDVFDVPRLGKVRLVEQFGGEGQGDEAWIVMGLTMCHDVERLFRKEGWHRSHDGTYYDGDLIEVVPRVVEKTVFEAVR